MRVHPVSLLRPAARRARVGMTLVEIMVVIAIIGILMTVLGVAVAARFKDAQVSTTKIQMNAIEEQVMMYSTKHKGKYPSTSEGLAAMKKYFPNEEIPKDSFDNDFLYFSPGTHGNHDYEIISLGADGKEGGTDENADINSWELHKSE